MIDFKKPYKREDYQLFFKNHFLPEDFVESEEIINIPFQPLAVNKLIKVGESTLLDLCVYEAEHGSENDPRVSLSRDIFKIMANYGKKRALVFLVSKTSPNYRLSLVTIDLKLEEGTRVKKEYSNPKRYSFFFGPDSLTHTPEESMVKQGRVKDAEDLKKRFSIEVVNKEFYTQIAVLFTELAGGKREIGRKSINAGGGLLKLPGTYDDTVRKEFTVRLIGRLVFCWFLKKKKSNKGLSLLSDDILSSQAVDSNQDYYHSTLEPLFFEVLNTPIVERNKKYQGLPWSNTPFLNGGLFSPHKNDYYEYEGVKGLKVPDPWLKGLISVFETYNFTIDENTSVDIELSIEPEMLGRIFENLLAEINPETGETARKSTGSYYTPREIVEYMVNESLKQYLLTKTKLNEEHIKSLLAYDKFEEDLSENDKLAVIEALDTIKIIDPACGSGAFPMGMLQKILLILQKVDPGSRVWFNKKLAVLPDKTLQKDLKSKLKAEYFNYLHKLGIIRDAIYGVDIQPVAIEISKLRFFLSLIVDENVDDNKENRGVEALPNLEFKFICANTLMGLPDRKDPNDLFEKEEDVASINKLKLLRDEYLRSFGKDKKRVEKEYLLTIEMLKEWYRENLSSKQNENGKIKDFLGNTKSIKKQKEPVYTKKLSEWNPFSDEACSWFDPEWMYGIKDGFDVVIGNPPYGAMYSDEHKEYFKDNYVSTKTITNIQKGSWDTFTIFIEQGFNVLRLKGNLNFIVPMAVTSSDAMTGLHNLLENNCKTIRISSYSNRPKQIFDNACIRTSILFFTRDGEKNKHLFTTKMIRRKQEDELDTLISNLQFIDSCSVKLKGRYPKISTDTELTILKKLFRAGKPIALLHMKEGKPIYYRTSGGRYFNVITNYSTGSTKEKPIFIRKELADVVGAIMSSNLFYFYQQVYSNGLDLKSYEIDNFPIPNIDLSTVNKIDNAYRKYLKDIEKYVIKHNNSSYENVNEYKEYKIYKSKLLIDSIDEIICPLYGLTQKQVEFIKNYEIEYRLRDEDKEDNG